MNYEEDDDVVLDDDTIALQELFAERDQAYADATQEIVDVIGPTLLEALYHIFGVPTDDVTWLDFQSTENLLIAICSVKYNPAVHTPQFIADTTEQPLKVDCIVEQTIRIGVPYEVVMKSSDEIINFINALAASHKNGGPTLIEHTDIREAEDDEVHAVSHEATSTSDVSTFSPDGLTAEQKQQMLLMQHQTRGKVH